MSTNRVSGLSVGIGTYETGSSTNPIFRGIYGPITLINKVVGIGKEVVYMEEKNYSEMRSLILRDWVTSTVLVISVNVIPSGLALLGLFWWVHLSMWDGSKRSDLVCTIEQVV